jgi:hypothetical protein
LLTTGTFKRRSATQALEIFERTAMCIGFSGGKRRGTGIRTRPAGHPMTRR